MLLTKCALDLIFINFSVRFINVKSFIVSFSLLCNVSTFSAYLEQVIFWPVLYLLMLLEEK